MRLQPIILASIRLLIRPAPHQFPPLEADAISDGWRRERERNPSLWNGSAFLFDKLAIDAVQPADPASLSSLEAEGAQTDYATFLYWRANRNRLPLSHIFPVAAILTRDRRLVVGRMSAHTANPGKLYPPAGSFDADDLQVSADGARYLDPMANIARELREEIGLEISRLDASPHWLLFPSNPGAHALVRIVTAEQTADELSPDLRRHIDADPDQELDDVKFLEFAARMPSETTMPYVNHLLAYLEAKG